MSDVTDKPVSESALWKQKYLDGVDELERRQRRWHQVEEMLRKIVSRLTLAADGRDAVLDKHLEIVRRDIRDRVDNSILSDHIEALSKALVRLDSQREPEPAAAVQAVPEAGKTGVLSRLFKSPAAPGQKSGPGGQRRISAEQALIDLLEHLEVPDSLRDQVSLLRERINAGELAADWDTLLDDITDLIDAMREHMRKDQDDLEEFLSEVSERLREVDASLRGTSELQDRGRLSRDDMDTAVRREVEGIGTSVREASDLGELKVSVESRLESVLDHMTRYREEDELRYQESQRNMDAMTERLQAMEQETQSLREQVNLEREQAMTDTLTGIPNRLAYDQRLKQEVARWKRFGTPLVLLVWDVDLFKSVNDNYGHKAGDRVLVKLANTLHAGIRETDFAARYGGEEFVMLMTGSPLDACKEVAEKLRSSLEQIGFHFRGKSVVVTASCGLSEYREGDTPEQLFERADKALYQAKEQGRNRCVTG